MRIEAGDYRAGAWKKKKNIDAEFIGIGTFRGEQCVKVNLIEPKNPGLQFIRKSMVSQGHTCVTDSQEIDKATARKVDIIQRPNFTKHFLGSVSPKDFALQQKLECQIIGRQNILKLEARTETFAVRNDDTLEVGNLNDVLRVKEIVRSGDPFRTEILTSRNGDHPGVEDKIPHVTIYDGANCFLKFGSDSSRRIRVAVLDRTEAGFTDATQNISDMFVNRRTSEVELRLNHYPPTGVDILAFMEAQR